MSTKYVINRRRNLSRNLFAPKWKLTNIFKHYELMLFVSKLAPHSAFKVASFRQHTGFNPITTLVMHSQQSTATTLNCPHFMQLSQSRFFCPFPANSCNTLWSVPLIGYICFKTCSVFFCEKHFKSFLLNCWSLQENCVLTFTCNVWSWHSTSWL